MKEAVTEACALLRAGEIVALPTETVYGLAADAFNPEANPLFPFPARLRSVFSALDEKANS